MARTLGPVAHAAHPSNLGFAGRGATASREGRRPYARAVSPHAAAHRAREQIARISASDAMRGPCGSGCSRSSARSSPFDAYAWVLTDPETSVGSAPLADVPCRSELPRLVRLRYLTPLNRWTTLDEAPVATLSGATGGDLARSLLWRELLGRYGVSDVASVVFRDRYGCWAFLELWRPGGATFTGADVAVLRDVLPPVTAALRHAQARTFATTPPPGHSLSGPLVLLLSPDLAVLRQTPGTHDPLRLLVPRDDAGPPVPAGAYNVAAQLLAVEQRVDLHAPTARVHLGEGRG